MWLCQQTWRSLALGLLAVMRIARLGRARSFIHSPTFATPGVRWLALSIFGFSLAFGRLTPGYGEIRPDFLMDSNPVLQFPESIKNFSPNLKALWMAALERPESDLQRLAAETIARGHEYGVPDLSQAIPRLETLLTSEKSHPATRFAAAHALIVLDSRPSSDKLLQVSQAYEAELRQLIEPALAKWSFAPAIAVWKDRLGQPDTRPRDLILALRGLAQVREASATSTLLAIVRDETRSADVRLEAATAAGQCATSGLELEAMRLAQSQTKRPAVNPICACRLLARHDSADARRILTELASHQEPVVAASALNRLLEIQSSLVVPFAEAALNHADPHIRLAGATAFLLNPTAERIAPLARLLADPHPSVRKEICTGLYRLSKQPELDAAIRTGAMQSLAQDAWQGQEQAALLSGMLAHQPAANRVVELLESTRAEVSISAAWALQKIAVPETIPALIDKGQRQTDRRKRESDPSLDDQVAHLFEALGVLKADAAVPLLTQYIPKDSIMGERSRGAAIWALGLIKAGKRDAELESALMDRINDFSDIKPESDLIKQMSAITLARMNAVDEAPQLRGIVESYRPAGRLGGALRWAVKELTGEELPPLEPTFLSQGTWFLEPLQ